MRILAANLKLYYQARALWFWYGVLIQFSFFLIFPAPTPHGYLGISLFFGLIAGDLQRTVLAKPFSFVLPKHRRILKSVLLITGPTVNLLLGLGFYEEFAKYSAAGLLQASAAVCLGIAFFFIGVGLSFLPGAPFYIVFVFFMYPLVGTFTSSTIFLIEYPAISIALSLILVAVILKLLNFESLARRLSGRFTFGITDIFNSAKGRKYWNMKSAERAAKRAEGTPDGLERIFLSRLKALPVSKRNRYVIGNIYMLRQFSSLRWWWLEVPSLLIMILFFCYSAEGGIRNYLFLVPGFFMIRMDLISHRSLLLTRGRGEKLYAALSFCFLLTFASSLLVLLAAVFSPIVTPIMPDIPWHGSVLVYHPLDIRYFYLCPLFLPLAMLLATLHRRERVLAIAFCVMAGMWLITDFQSFLTPGSAIGVLGVSCLVAASWLLCTLGITYHCLKQDLVVQGG